MSRKNRNTKPCLVKASDQWESIKKAVEELEDTGSALGKTLAEWTESARINGWHTFEEVGLDGVAQYYDLSGTEDYDSETFDDMCKGCFALKAFDLTIPEDYLLAGVTQEEAEAAQLAILKQCL